MKEATCFTSTFYLFLLVAITLFPNKIYGNDQSESFLWTKDIQLNLFMKIDSLPGSDNYYSVIDSSGFPFIRAQYTPDKKSVKLGYQLPQNLSTATNLCWQWRIINPPIDSDESKGGKNDSGGAVYLVFKPGAQTHVIKYVFSSSLPAGTILKNHPFAPFYKMYIVVVNKFDFNNRGKWLKESVDFCLDYKNLYNSPTCPPLLGIGIMSDGDGTKSQVVADYAKFSISREK